MKDKIEFISCVPRLSYKWMYSLLKKTKARVYVEFKISIGFVRLNLNEAAFWLTRRNLGWWLIKWTGVDILGGLLLGDSAHGHVLQAWMESLSLPSLESVYISCLFQRCSFCYSIHWRLSLCRSSTNSFHILACIIIDEIQHTKCLSPYYLTGTSFLNG